MNIPNIQNLNSSTCTERYFKNHYPEMYEYLLQTYPQIENHIERLYWFCNNIKEYPKCPICGNPVKFINLKLGYREFCSIQCISKSAEVLKRKENTSIRNWGTLNPSQSKKVKEKIKSTCLEKYGVDNPSKSFQIKEKIKKTNLEKYGVEYPLSAVEIREKIKKTNLEKYGVEHNTQREDVKNKLKKNYDNILLELDKNIVNIDGDNLICKCSDNKCNLCKEKIFTIPRYLHNSRFHHNQEICTIKNPIGVSGKDTVIENFVKDILEEYNIPYISNTRAIISPQELDIYIPTHNIAIECNGCYWHSDVYKDKNYHYNKYQLCKDKGIQLIQVWEDQVINNKEIIKSIILSKLGIYKKRIYARQTHIKLVNNKECNIFLKENHLQGVCPSSIKLGLYYKDELVSVMTFGKKRENIIGSNKCDYEWELVRFCNKKGFQVVGGASKLLNNFISKYDPVSIGSFSSNDISNGNIYMKLGFEFINNSQGSYWYVDQLNFKRYHRYRFRKSELIKSGFDKNKSESEIMKCSKYLKIYDAGQCKWIWCKNKIN